MKLNWYVFSQLALAFLIAAAGMIFIALPGLAVGAVHKLGSVGMLAVLMYLPMVVAGFVPYVVPVALLLSLVSTYGKLAANNEWTAIRMAGVNPYRMLVPAFALALVAGSSVYYMNADLLPWINIRMKTQRIEMLRHVFKNLSPGQTHITLQDFFLQSTLRDPVDPNTFYDCYVEFPPREGKGRQAFYAEAVRFEFGDVKMYTYLYNARGAAETVQWSVGDPVIEVDLEKLTEAHSKHSYDSSRYLSSRKLRQRIKSGGLPESQLKDFLYTWHHRMANGVTCLMFVLVGVSSGILLRKGTQLAALAVAVGYALVYWVFSLRLGEQLAVAGVVAPWLGAWGPLVLFCGVGGWLTHRAFRE